jgi:hypothetical protein
VKEEYLSKIILFGERSLRWALSEYIAHYHAERNHQGKSNVLLFRQVTEARREEPVQCHERLGALLRYYHQEAARVGGQIAADGCEVAAGPGRAYAKADALLMTMTAGKLTSWLPLTFGRTRPGNQPMTDRGSVNRRSNLPLNRQKP